MPGLGVIYRLSVEDFFPGGLPFSEGRQIAMWAAQAGADALHVTAGVTIMLIVLGLALGRQVTSANRAGVGLVSWYWHFVDGVWVVVFTVVYLVGR